MAALKNWKRPSMNELPAPTEPYIHADRRRQQRYNTIFIVGVAFLGFTIAFAKVTESIKFYGMPAFAKKTGYVSKYETKTENDEDGFKQGELHCKLSIQGVLDLRHASILYASFQFYITGY